MPIRFSIIALCGLIGSSLAGCSNPTPASVEPTETPEIDRAAELKKFEGEWILKSSVEISPGGTYPVNTSDNGEVIVRIRDANMERREGEEPWVKYATISLGMEPQSLIMTKSDASGKRRVLPLRYKLDGNSLITVQDNHYPDILPDSFDMESGIDRHRQTNTYVRTKP
jgi:hypothetical protein